MWSAVNWNLRSSYNSQKMAVAPLNPLFPQAMMVPQAVLDTYGSPLGTQRLPGHPVLNPTPPDSSTSTPNGLPPSAFLLNRNTSLNRHPLPVYSDSPNPGPSATRSTAVAQPFTTSLPRAWTVPGPIFNTYGAFFDGHPLQGHSALPNPGQPLADSTVVAQSETLGMGSSSATIPQGMASLVSDFAEDNATPAGLQVQAPKVSEDNGDESFKEKPPHHRSAKVSRCSELREHVQNTRRSKASNHPRPHKPKRKTERRAAPVSNVPRRASYKISLEASQTLITEWQQLNLEKTDLPAYEVVSPTYDKEHQDGFKWRCSFLGDKGQCIATWRRKAEAERHSLTHHPVRWLCLNPSCGKALSREDAAKRHYERSPGCKSHSPAGANLEIDATTTGPVVALSAEGPKLVRIRWVTASD